MGSSENTQQTDHAGTRDVDTPVDIILLAVERGQALLGILNEHIPADDIAENRALAALLHSISSQFEVIEAQAERGLS